MKNKLFHEAAIDPAFVTGENAMVVMREFRLDRARYIEKMPEDWAKMCKDVLMSEQDEATRHKKLSYLNQIQNSVLRIRKGRVAIGKDWKEQVAAAARLSPFDVILGDGRATVEGAVIDIDEYLIDSEPSIGSVEKVFKHPMDWISVLQPVVSADNSIVLVDRYFDLKQPDYYNAFTCLIELIAANPLLRELRIVVAPTVSKEDASPEEHIRRRDSLVGQVRGFLREHSPGLKTGVFVFSVPELHKRYLTSKHCGLELDFGLRVHRTKKQRISVLRSSQMKEVCSTYMALAMGGISAWPIRDV
jgi:hypothetical protein